MVCFNDDPAGVLFAVDNDKVVADLQLVVRPGGWPLLLVHLHDHEFLRPVVHSGRWPLCIFMTMIFKPSCSSSGAGYFLFHYLKDITVIAMLYLGTQGDDDFDSHWLGPLLLDF